MTIGPDPTSTDTARQRLIAVLVEAHAVDEFNPTWVMCSPDAIADTVLSVPLIRRALARDAYIEATSDMKLTKSYYSVGFNELLQRLRRAGVSQ